MKVLVIGKSGQLGQSIKKLIDEKTTNYNFYFVARDQLDLENLDSLHNYFENNVFDILINCASFNDVDKAEYDNELANRVNHIAVREIAKIAKKKNMKLIHISTDYVFDGKKNKPYIETDNTSPLNYYGKSKLAGENAILSVMQSNAVILRTAWVYSEFGNNFVNTVLNLASKNHSIDIVSDQFGTPTFAYDLAKVIISIIHSDLFISKNMPSKLYNFSNEGECSWFDFGSEIVKISRMSCIVNPIKTIDYPLPAKRPKNSILDKRLISEEFDLNIRHWKESLKNCLENL